LVENLIYIDVIYYLMPTDPRIVYTYLLKQTNEHIERKILTYKRLKVDPYKQKDILLIELYKDRKRYINILKNL